jgi:membrane-associated phospholipid phosphatase
MKGNRFLFAFSLLQFALFVPVAWWAHKHPQPPLELAVTYALQRKRSGFLHAAIRVLSKIAGSAPVLNVLVVPTALLLWKQHWRLEALLTVAISWSNALARTVIKQLVHRPRPSPMLVLMSDRKQTKSFPSGHVCSSVDFWGWLAAISLLRGTTPWHKGLAGFAVLCLVCVGPSRVYLGDHWATDVLGGYLFGGGWLGLSLQFYFLLRARQDQVSSPAFLANH